MHTQGLNHLSDTELLRDLRVLLSRERGITAAVLAHLAEVDARRLYAPAGYPSMFEYCVGELHLSEDAALKRIQAARAGRRFPAIFEALAEGRLHLTAVVRLAPHLTRENAGELLAAAAGKTKSEIEEWLAQRFPRTELLALVEAVPGTPPEFRQLVPEPVADHGPEPTEGRAGQLVPEPVPAPTPRASLTPQAPQRFALHVSIGQSTHDRLRYAQELLGHRIPSGDVAQVLDLALEVLVKQLEKRKFAAARTPRPRPRRSDANPRHIPAHVKRAVWERDQGRCTFVGPTGHRCGSRKFLEFDHVEPVARGGRATVAGIRLRCRAHNQYEAERTFGAGFMDEKREQARRVAEQARARVAAAEVIPYLRALGFRADESRRAAAHGVSEPSASLEERVRRALSYFRPRAHSHAPAAPSLAGAP
jgi:5-methylcytosine-specific restriction endonuclease McrA